MIVCGIDPSLNCTSLVFISGENKGLFGNNDLKIKKVQPKDLRGGKRLRFIYERLYDAFNDEPRMDMIFVEGYSYGSTNRAFKIGELGGIIKEFFFCIEQDIIIIPPAMWKKAILNNGHATKEEIKKFVETNYNIEFTKQDDYDAYCLALFAKIYTEYKNNTISNEDLVKYRNSLFKLDDYIKENSKDW
ncbi:MAG: hypothetical protein ACTSQY_00925 [Candidatus Odinarchaeia archaeon]